MKRYTFPLTIILLLFAVIALAAPGDKHPAVTSAAIGLGTSSSPTLASVTATTSVTAPAYNSTAVDGYHYIMPYNSIAFAGTPLVGMIQTTPTGPQWYTGSAWEAIGSGGASAIADLTDWPSGLTATELGYLDGATSNIQAQINAISVGSPVTTVPTYSDQSCTAGQYAFDASYAYFCRTANTWDRIALGGWSNPTPDTTPDAFAFTDETGVAINTAKTSNAITVAGINSAAAISVTGDTGYGYSKNSAACTATSGTVVAGDTVAACVTSSGSNSTATTATVTIGGVSDTYSVTTAAGSAGINDAFDTDTRASYTKLTGGTLVYDSTNKWVACGSGGTGWSGYNSTSLNSSNQTIYGQIDVTSSGNSYVIARYDNSANTRYQFGVYYYGANKLGIAPINGSDVVGTKIYFTTPSGSSFVSGTKYSVKLVVSGDTWHGYVDFNNNGIYDEIGEDFGTVVESTYSVGTYAGFSVPNAFATITFDNFVANGN